MGTGTENNSLEVEGGLLRRSLHADGVCWSQITKGVLEFSPRCLWLSAEYEPEGKIVLLFPAVRNATAIAPARAASFQSFEGVEVAARSCQVTPLNSAEKWDAVFEPSKTLLLASTETLHPTSHIAAEHELPDTQPIVSVPLASDLDHVPGLVPGIKTSKERRGSGEISKYAPLGSLQIAGADCRYDQETVDAAADRLRCFMKTLAREDDEIHLAYLNHCVTTLGDASADFFMSSIETLICDQTFMESERKLTGHQEFPVSSVLLQNISTYLIDGEIAGFSPNELRLYFLSELGEESLLQNIAESNSMIAALVEKVQSTIEDPSIADTIRDRLSEEAAEYTKTPNPVTEALFSLAQGMYTTAKSMDLFTGVVLLKLERFVMPLLLSNHRSVVQAHQIPYFCQAFMEKVEAFSSAQEYLNFETMHDEIASAAKPLMSRFFARIVGA